MLTSLGEEADFIGGDSDSAAGRTEPLEFPRKSLVPSQSPSSLWVFYILIFEIGRHGEIRMKD